MRKFLLPSAAALFLTLGPAVAQVSVDPRALDALKPDAHSAAPSEPAPKKPPARPAPRPPAKTAAVKPVPAKPQPPPPAPPPPAPPQPPPPVIPAAPPPLPVIPPPITVPVRPVQAPAPAVVTPDAPGESTAIPDGIRITFGGGRSDLNPAGLEALRGLAHDAADSPSSNFNITAFAAGAPEDPSSPRRLSLARALTVRSVLIAQGFASTRIYVKALGATTSALAEGPPDRVDIVVAGMRPAAQGSTKTSGTQTPPAPSQAAKPNSPPPATQTQVRPAP